MGVEGLKAGCQYAGLWEEDIGRVELGIGGVLPGLVEFGIGGGRLWYC